MTSPVKITSKTDRIFINLGDELANLPRVFTRILNEKGAEVAEFDFEDAAELKNLTDEPQKFYIEYRVRTDSMPKKKSGGLNLGGLNIPIGGISIPLPGGKKDDDQTANDGRTYQYFYILISVRANSDYVLKMREHELISSDLHFNPVVPPLKNDSQDVLTGQHW